jgi:murein DD-endopeptidase MepM/ murein hydrolase activator NlpD
MVFLTGVGEKAGPSAKYDGRSVSLFRVPEGWAGLFAVNVRQEPGAYPLDAAWTDEKSGKTHRRLVVTTVDKDYGTRNLTVPDNQVNLSPEDLARHEKERKLVVAALAVRSSERLWRGPWKKPVPGPSISSFGRRTVMNGVLKPSPHGGVDLDGAEGDFVTAPAAGRVVLAGNHFFAGGSIYLDHGLGLITVYMHLSRIDVKEGQTVADGDPLGLVGMTGRVTGPHLHYGLYLNQISVDPYSVHDLVERLGID